MVCTSCSAENDEDADSCFQCGKSLYALTEGAILAGRYQILKTVGRGGMGIVYKAHDRELDEVVAVKLLRSETIRSTDALRRLKGEVRLARKVRHRNVSAIHELGQEGPLRFVVMEFVDGIDLKHILRERGRLPAQEAFPLLTQAAAGLAAIHDAGIVHRDLKTPNIMLDHRGLVRLMDFGIAKQFGVESEAGGTATGNVVGTPEYMSPEQVRGEKLDVRSDIYALGIVVFELLTGAVPFKGDTPLATIFKHIQEPPPLEGDRARHIPAPFIPILRKMLEKDREERMATAEDFIAALEAAQPLLSAQGAGAPMTRQTILLDAEVPEDEPDPFTATMPIPTAVPTRPRVPVPAMAAPPTAQSQQIESHEVGSRTAATAPVPAVAAALPIAKTAETAVPRSAAPRPTPTSTRQPPPGAREGRTPSRPQSWVLGGIAVLAVVGLLGWWLMPENQAVPVGAAEVAQVEAEPIASPLVPAPAVPSLALVVEEKVVVPRFPATTPPPRATQATSAPRTVRPAPSPQLRATPWVTSAPVATPTPIVTMAAAPTTTAAEAPIPQPTFVPPTIASAQVPTAEPVVQQSRPAEPPGVLQLQLKQVADVLVDGQLVRPRTKSVRLDLPAGRHTLEIRHPKFEPLKRVFMVATGQSIAIGLDLEDEAVKKR